MDIGIVSSNSIDFKVEFSSSVTCFISAFDKQNNSFSTVSFTEKTALYSGSSKHGKALLASVDSN